MVARPLDYGGASFERKILNSCVYMIVCLSIPFLGQGGHGTVFLWGAAPQVTMFSSSYKSQ